MTWERGFQEQLAPRGVVQRCNGAKVGLVASFEQEAAVVEMGMSMEMGMEMKMGMKMEIAMGVEMEIKMKVWMTMMTMVALLLLSQGHPSALGLRRRCSRNSE